MLHESVLNLIRLSLLSYLQESLLKVSNGARRLHSLRVRTAGHGLRALMRVDG